MKETRPVFSIVIPTWNGLGLLKKNLPQVAAAAGKRVELVVVDNGSSDGSAAWIKKNFPEAVLIGLSRNYGFGPACNLGMEKANAELVVLLNNDVVPEKDFLKPVQKIFADKRVFAVSLNEPQFSWAAASFEEGFFHHFPGPRTSQTHVSLWGSGGSAVFRREYWRRLGGFDPLYHPFYWEDVDLGFRAWKRGWRVLWEPKAVVHHRHEGTVSRFSPRFVALIKQRNELLFTWKNITDSELTRKHLKALVRKLVAHPGYLKIVLAALVKLPSVLVRRRREKAAAVLSDQQIFTFFK